MTKILFVAPEKCVGCMLCVMVCSLKQNSEVSPVQTRILPIRMRKEVINIPVVCRQCLKPLCADACPMGAISRNQATGAMVVDPDLCIGCGMCMMACPLGGIALDMTRATRAVKCDLCQGDPQCAKVCCYGAIRYVDIEAIGLERRKEAVQKLAVMLEKIVFD